MFHVPAAMRQRQTNHGTGSLGGGCENQVDDERKSVMGKILSLIDGAYGEADLLRSSNSHVNPSRVICHIPWGLSSLLMLPGCILTSLLSSGSCLEGCQKSWHSIRPDRSIRPFTFDQSHVFRPNALGVWLARMC